MSDYFTTPYWDDRYTYDSDFPFEWYCSYTLLEKTLRDYIFGRSHVLVVGCGSSQLSEEIYNNLSKKVTSIDISEVVVQRCNEIYEKKCRDLSGQFLVMDVRNIAVDRLPVPRFDVIVDKGTLDSLFCSESALDEIPAALTEISKVLKPNGVFICISFAGPNQRMAHFSNSAQYRWSCQNPVVIEDPEGAAKKAQQRGKQGRQGAASAGKATSAGGGMAGLHGGGHHGGGGGGGPQDKDEEPTDNIYIYICSKASKE